MNTELLRGVFRFAHRTEMQHLKLNAALRLVTVLEHSMLAAEAASWLMFVGRYELNTLQASLLKFIQRHGSDVLMSEASRD